MYSRIGHAMWYINSKRAAVDFDCTYYIHIVDNVFFWWHCVRICASGLRRHGVRKCSTELSVPFKQRRKLRSIRIHRQHAQAYIRSRWIPCLCVEQITWTQTHQKCRFLLSYVSMLHAGDCRIVCEVERIIEHGYYVNNGTGRELDPMEKWLKCSWHSVVEFYQNPRIRRQNEWWNFQIWWTWVFFLTNRISSEISNFVSSSKN